MDWDRLVGRTVAFVVWVIWLLNVKRGDGGETVA